MSKRKIYHIVPDETGWKIKQQNSSRALRKFNTKDEAVNFARNLAKQNEPSQIKIHKKNGKFQEERTFDKDPFPPKG